MVAVSASFQGVALTPKAPFRLAGVQHERALELMAGLAQLGHKRHKTPATVPSGRGGALGTCHGLRHGFLPMTRTGDAGREVSDVGDVGPRVRRVGPLDGQKDRPIPPAPRTRCEHLAIRGAAALSLRAIARDLGMVSSGLYRYVGSRDDLLTRLTIDAYTSLAKAVTLTPWLRC